MNMDFNKKEYENIDFEDRNFNEQDLTRIDFYNCKFINCSFQFAKFQSSSFENCLFQNCNLALVSTIGTRFFDTTFLGSKLSGINWGECNGIFKADFKDCLMENSFFTNMDLQRYEFSNSNFKGSSFTHSNLNRAKFINCDLTDCLFHNTKLYKTDFSTSYNYYISADANNISGAIFSLPEAASLLQNFDITII